MTTIKIKQDSKIMIRLPRDMRDKLHRIARAKGTDVSTMFRDWAKKQAEPQTKESKA